MSKASPEMKRHGIKRPENKRRDKENKSVNAILLLLLIDTALIAYYFMLLDDDAEEGWEGDFALPLVNQPKPESITYPPYSLNITDLHPPLNEKLPQAIGPPGGTVAAAPQSPASAPPATVQPDASPPVSLSSPPSPLPSAPSPSAPEIIAEIPEVPALPVPLPRPSPPPEPAPDEDQDEIAVLLPDPDILDDEDILGLVVILLPPALPPLDESDEDPVPVTREEDPYPDISIPEIDTPADNVADPGEEPKDDTTEDEDTGETPEDTTEDDDTGETPEDTTEDEDTGETGAGDNPDVNVEAPQITSPATAPPLPENTEVVASRTIYTAMATQTLDTITWSLESSGDGDLFVIDPATGVVTFKTAVIPDYEAKDEYSFKIEASSGPAGAPKTAAASITVTVTDEDEVPGAMALSASSVRVTEGTSQAMKLADITFTDDALGSNSATVDDTARFEIRNDTSGAELWLKAGVALDHESAASHAVTVTPDVTGAGTPPPARIFTLEVGDADEAGPVFTGAPYAFDLAENADGSVTAVTVGQVTASDADGTSNEVSYRLINAADQAVLKVGILRSTGRRGRSAIPGRGRILRRRRRATA